MQERVGDLNYLPAAEHPYNSNLRHGVTLIVGLKKSASALGSFG